MSNVLLKNHWKNTLFLGFSSLGAIYGDIGTSPLYVFSSIFPEGDPSKKDIIGATSCLFWLFFLLVIVKYCLIVLYYGPNNNEGGQIAIYAKIAAHLHIGPRGVIMDNDGGDLLSFTRSETHDSSNRIDDNDDEDSKRNFWSYFKIKDGRYNRTLVNKYLSKIIMGLCFLGCGLVSSDGLLTPTTSVLSAVDGISVVSPSFENKVLPVSCVILILLFLAQRFGSGKISLLFAPIIFIWLILILITGIINIAKHYPKIFVALNPAEAIWFFQRYRNFDKIGAVMLAVTGTEAMFADIGHFSRLSVQLTLGFFVFPCLMFAYFGQAAYLIKNPDGISNLFYLSIPGGTETGLYWIMFIFATLATVIASQALILGVFSIFRQLIHLDCLPNFKVVHKSSKNFGQVYLPAVNYILMILVVCTCVGFKTSSNVTAAYGLGVALDFGVTTIMLTICLLYVFKVNVFIAGFFFLVFGALEMCLIIAGMKKVPHGAWFPLTVSILVTLFIVFWRWARSLKVNQEYNDRIKIKNVLVNNQKQPLSNDNKQISFDLGKKENVQSNVNPINDNDNLDPNYKIKYQEKLYDFYRYQGVGIMHTNVIHTLNSASTVPKLFEKLVTSFPSLPKKFIFLTVRITSEPYVKNKDHITLEKLKSVEFSGLYRCVVKFGFMDRIKITSSTIKAILKTIEFEEIDEEIEEITKFKTSNDDEDGYVDDHFNKEEISLLDPEMRVLHIIENSLIAAKNYNPFLHDDENFLIKNCYKLGHYFKNILITQIYVPISNLFEGFEASVEQENNGDLVLFGNKVEI